jgi:dephospho-CoA kinase
MQVYGLTGGIASGKSTVSRMLRELGVTLIDADALAREVVEPGQPGLAELASRFPFALTPDGRLDRARLAEHVFARPSEREALNALLHPLIAAAFEKRRSQAEAQGVPFVVYDAALLFENGLHEQLDGVILVTLPPELQRARLMARDGLTLEQARQRLSAQWPLERKRPLARWVVDNSGTEAETRAHVRQVWEAMSAQA